MRLLRIVMASTWVAAGVALGSSVHALDFSPANLVYEESFVGETGFPTTPEVDELGDGGLLPAAGSSISVTSGGEAAGAVSAPGPGPGPSQAGAGFTDTSVGTGNIGLRGRFNDLTVSGFGVFRAGVDAFYGSGAVYGVVLVQTDGSSSAGELLVSDNDLGSSQVMLGATELSAAARGIVAALRRTARPRRPA